MIYQTIEDVERNHKYAQEAEKNLKESAIRYLNEVVEEAGALVIETDAHGTMLLCQYQPYGKELTFYGASIVRASDMSSEFLCNICKHVHTLGLVEEHQYN